MLGQDAPVLLLGFNRPDKVAAILQPLREVRPSRVFFSVDGPRESVPADRPRCEETRAAFVQGIDWPCEVKSLVRERNLGCRAAVSGAIGWAFEQVDRLVILEDDCVVEPSFLDFCSTLLERYADDPKIMHIAAANFQGGHWRGDGDSYASKYAHCWGWATWRRAWQHYEDDLASLSCAVAPPVETTIHGSEDERSYWRIIFERCQRGEVDSWAYRWLFSCWKNGGLTLIPNQNQVTNLGFTGEGTHTNAGASGLAPAARLEGFSAPSSLAPETEADDYTFRQVFCPPLSEVEKQVHQHRIRQLKADLKAQKEENTRLKAALKAAEQSRPWWKR